MKCLHLVQDNDGEVLVLNTIGDEAYKDKMMARFVMKGQKCSMQVDSQATCNVIPRRHVPEDVLINSCTKRLSLYGNKATVDGLEVCSICPFSKRIISELPRYVGQAEFMEYKRMNTVWI